MNYKIIYLSLVLLGFILGCSSTAEPQDAHTIGSITVTSNNTPTLVGGGRWFTGPDTGIWYDVNFDYVLKNSSSDSYTLRYTVEFSGGGGALFFDTTGIFTGGVVLEGNQTKGISIPISAGIGRRVKDWTKPYTYTVTLTDVATGSSTTFQDDLQGSNPDNRFHGVVYTTEQSSDPQALLDAPDDGDWVNLNTDAAFVLPIYPNPLSEMASLKWVIQKPGAFVTFSLHKTPLDTLFSHEGAGPLQAGEHTFGLNFSSFKQNGMYRMYFKAQFSDTTLTFQGDIIINH